MGISDPKFLENLGLRIREKRESKGWTQPKLAKEAGYSDKTIRDMEKGRRTRPRTALEVCEALELDIHAERASGIVIADVKYGSYNLAHYSDYVGVYFAFRRGLSYQENFLRTVFKISWSEERRCLKFFEHHQYISSEGEPVDNSQRGDIYIGNEVGLLHLITSDEGAIRLITLSKLRRPGNILQGVVLTQLKHSIHYSPAVAPIYLQKLRDVASRSEVSGAVGPISPTHEDYQTVAACIEEVEREVVYFPPVGAFDPKVTRIPARVSKPSSEGTA